MRCLHPSYISGGAPGSIAVPCGRCMACRINKTSEWATRLMTEMHNYYTSCFITLTYNDENLKDPSLNKRDFQLFFKRVRKHYGFPDMKYFACGEYGPTTFRKHGHAIVLGVDFKPWHLISKQNGRLIFGSELLSKLWPFGFATVDIVTYADCKYVTGYIRKKLSGPAADVYSDRGLIPPFQLQSKGIGLGYALANESRLRRDLHMRVNGKIVPIPKYMARKIGLNNPDESGYSPLLVKAKEIEYEKSFEFARSRYADMYDYEFLYRNDARAQREIDLKSKEQLFAARDKL